MSLPIQYLYVIAIILFVLSLRWMSEVRTSRRGNWAGAAAMLTAIIATLLAFPTQRNDLLIVAIVVGTVIGIPIALKLPMTAVPQRTAMSHAFGSLAVALVGTAKYYQLAPNIDTFTLSVLSFEIILGFLTFTGSCVAFAKLQELISGTPFIYPGRTVVTLSSLGIAIVLAIYLILNPAQGIILPIMVTFALLFGFLLVMSIGGADMPTVIAILNSYAGLSAAALGFVLDSKILIVAGTLDGASGFILALIMSKAMNRSFINVLFGGVGTKMTKDGDATTVERTVQSYTVEDIATILDNARSVVIAPGYGMAVSQAQHVVKEFADIIQARGIDVKYAIHPVAGRMPGHMNVLLAESQVPYDQLWEMEQINSLFPETDIAIVVGANDVTNPASRTNPDSPLYGMPILDVDKARTVVFIKRTLNTGFAAVGNELFYLPNTMMVFGDAKKVLSELVASLKQR
ncbi:MAG: NAD synthetase [Dehalococcoidales bacterium]|jgi:NAD(P) transhydrogenase subunit beta|nr:NAD synthetase [Dehalococcoidales bacterium]MDP6221374.1 NAD(P)(+) transhydrogenase (Re/Si-specific) subunit beta [Dehalococcoidales bacterium]MDP7109640.1 NAD(P)(+) transhydrogenase (Re/Si-specific) subunit beta [Dehalococcoidales bacterium]MDP7310051.1 NAD(P)(+) transhydrogenase (Re/Si-specific) subunit beta [Dehalococcoidales bacterium]MDP7409573.1 NAD(P)(+) transhydrogenase (Re/Si-specific) subunit beta [Dehalococcoidales bacterium]|tara:strand:- start:1349 stop:2725 length:1377 start_codon:yes stop_codon:yes gene_type:complete